MQQNISNMHRGGREVEDIQGWKITEDLYEYCKTFVFISIIGDFIPPPHFRPNILVLRDFFFLLLLLLFT